jgi:hypothetical protein
MQYYFFGNPAPLSHLFPKPGGFMRRQLPICYVYGTLQEAHHYSMPIFA